MAVVSWIRIPCGRLELALATCKIPQQRGCLRTMLERLRRLRCGLLSLQVAGWSGIRSLGSGEKTGQLDVKWDGTYWTGDHYPRPGGNKKRPGQKRGEWVPFPWRSRSGARWPSLGGDWRLADALVQMTRRPDYTTQASSGAVREKIVDVPGPEVGFWCWWG
jgi:hypothetical protein